MSLSAFVTLSGVKGRFTSTDLYFSLLLFVAYTGMILAFLESPEDSPHSPPVKRTILHSVVIIHLRSFQTFFTYGFKNKIEDLHSYVLSSAAGYDKR
jgi:hypothetical protein